jgi:hypothetical protein
VHVVARKRGEERGAVVMERHPFKESTTEVGDGPTKVPCCGKGT